MTNKSKKRKIDEDSVPSTIQADENSHSSVLTDESRVKSPAVENPNPNPIPIPEAEEKIVFTSGSIEKKVEKSLQREPSKSVRFTSVNVYEFERCQGFSSIPGNFAPLNETITLGMRFKHDWEESFPNVEEYLKYKRRMDLDKLEAFVRQQEQDQFSLNRPELAMGDGLHQTPSASSSFLDLQRDRLERAKLILSNREMFENDPSLDLDMDPDISCPVLTNEERMEKLARKSVDDHVSHPTTIDLFDKTECDEVNEILKSREICGCDCHARNQTCTTDECSCFANGINCQIDRNGPTNYPCRCNTKKCKNSFGLKKFNWRLVDKHRKEVLSRNWDDDGLPVRINVEQIDEPLSTPNKTANSKKRRTFSSLSPHKRKKPKNSN